jgi:hypothetical protein
MEDHSGDSDNNGNDGLSPEDLRRARCHMEGMVHSMVGCMGDAETDTILDMAKGMFGEGEVYGLLDRIVRNVRANSAQVEDPEERRRITSDVMAQHSAIAARVTENMTPNGQRVAAELAEKMVRAGREATDNGQTAAEVGSQIGRVITGDGAATLQIWDAETIEAAGSKFAAAASSAASAAASAYAERDPALDHEIEEAD